MTAATAIPFGPFLALAGWLSWLYGGWLQMWLSDTVFALPAGLS